MNMTQVNQKNPSQQSGEKIRWNIVVAFYLLIELVFLMLAAHVLRRNHFGAAATLALLPLAIFLRQKWFSYVLSALLFAGSLLWINASIMLIRIRLSIGAPWLRLSLILGAIILITLLTPLIFRHRAWENFWKKKGDDQSLVLTATAILTVLLLGFVQYKVRPPLLLLERFFFDFGWLEIAAAMFYAVWVAQKLLSPNVAKERRRIWLYFSIIFFSQLALGLLVDKRFLMRPDVLHFPIPALILAGPLFRAEHFFMVILFFSTLVVVGPAWCSHICYLGSWDAISAAKGPKRPKVTPKWLNVMRVILVILVLSVAFLLGRIGASPLIAGSLALAFGLIGVVFMLTMSRKLGVMVHCISYCPIGLVANLLGKSSPFRIKIADSCTNCGRCSIACRYDALGQERVAKREVGLNCTLCGDCLPTCKGADIQMHFLKLSPTIARKVFVVLVVALHTAALCFARV